jgi:hypothetical protein
VIRALNLIKAYSKKGEKMKEDIRLLLPYSKLAREFLFLLKVHLMRSGLKENAAEGLAKVLVEARRAGLLGFCLDMKNGKIYFHLNAENEDEGLTKYHEWTVKQRDLGHMDNKTYKWMLESEKRLKTDYLDPCDEYA